jgi:hydrophobe/amphiphile efflux-1 (HAE1) family protein
LSISSPFIYRPVGTTLLTIAVALAGALAYQYLPVSPLPQVDFPTISVGAGLPGASPETMASSVATPLERQFGHIAGITEMTSSSQLGSTSITLQFDLNRNIDAAARDVQAAINAAAGNLPANLPTNPTYRKVNPADAPILILAITSDIYTKAKMYDVASSVLAQELAQVDGVGQVSVGGGALPGVRVDVNPTALNVVGLGLMDVQNVLAAANADSPKGDISDSSRRWTLQATDQLFTAAEYRPLILTYNNGSAVRLSDIATVTDSVEDIRTMGLTNGKPAILLVIFRQPGANIISTVDHVLSMMTEMQAEIPAAMHLSVVMDRTTTIRASVHDTEVTLLMSVCLVVLVVFVFLRDVRSTVIPSVAVPISLIGTFGVMYLAGYSVDNLSLMALTVATGFVVDDAIVVIENITRHLEAGMQPLKAALLGAKEIGFTVLSMSTSLVAVFIPILLMGGIVGRYFREFAVVLSVAIGVSLLVSLTTTPMMCAALLRTKGEERHGRIYRFSEKAFQSLLNLYDRTLRVVLRHPLVMIVVTLLTIVFTIFLYFVVPKGFFPQQDTGRVIGTIQADQDTSFQAMSRLLTQFSAVLSSDRSTDGVIAFCGGGRTNNTATVFVNLKPIGQRKESADQWVARMRKKLGGIPGATLYLNPVQDLRVGGRSSNAQYQYTLQDDNLDELLEWAPKLTAKLRTVHILADVNSDQQTTGLAANLVIDRATAARLGVSTSAIDAVLYDAFGQAQVSTMYTALNQYAVVLEVADKYWQNQDGLKYIYVPGANGTQVPLSAVAHYEPGVTSITVNHQGQYPSATISFTMPVGLTLSDAVTAINKAKQELGMPATVRGGFQGTAQAFQATLANQPILITAAILAIYIVLGMLYESLVHPITILSTLPSAGVGALLALLICGVQLDVMGLIGIILLIGIVKKNAIMMIDFALQQERTHNMKPADAIYQACLLRFRPIMMTTMAALLGGLPLALGSGVGSELRRPLGIAIVGGLIVSQLLTLYTTPIIYLYMDRVRFWSRRAVRVMFPIRR